MRSTVVLLAAGLICLSACGPRTDESGASPSEARQLDAAAQSLDANIIDPSPNDSADNAD